MSTLVPLFPMIIHGIKPMYVIYFKFVLISF